MSHDRARDVPEHERRSMRNVSSVTTVIPTGFLPVVTDVC